MTWASQPERMSSNVFKRGEVCGILKVPRSREIKIMANHPARWRNLGFISRSTGALALAVCLSAGAYAQEQQSPQQREPQQTQDTQPKPSYTPQDADRPPYSQDRPAPPPAAPAPSPQVQPIPGTLTVPAGTILLIRINEYLSSDHSRIGDQFTAVLENPIVVNGWVVARRGQVLVGQVKEARKAGRVKGTSELGVELTDMSVADGRQMPILTELWKASGGTSHGQDAATIATTTGLGALIGAAADWGTRAASAAGPGSAAGIGAVLLTRGRPTILDPESQLSFRLVDPVRIDTTQSQQAFLPVTQQDFDGGRSERRGPRPLEGGKSSSGPPLYTFVYSFARYVFTATPTPCIFGFFKPIYPVPRPSLSHTQ